MKTKVLVPVPFENWIKSKPDEGIYFGITNEGAKCDFYYFKKPRRVAALRNSLYEVLVEREVFIIEQLPTDQIEIIEGALDQYWDRDLTKNQVNDLISEIGAAVEKITKLLTGNNLNEI